MNKTISCSQSTYDKISAHAKKLDCGLGKALDNIFRQEVSHAENKADLSAEAVATTPQTTDMPITPEAKQKEVSPMEVNEIRELIKAERAEERRAEEFEALKSAIVEKDKSLSELAEALKAERGKEPEMEALKAERGKEPEMEDAFEHYKTCKNPDCRVTKGFNTLIANAQKPENLTTEQVKAAMEHHKIAEAPERIVISGLGMTK